MTKNINLNFHQSVSFSLDYLAKILKISNGDSSLTKEEISEITGIPTGKSSGKVVPHIYYGLYMGLITFNLENNRYTLSRTDLGNLILLEDPYLSEDLTIRLLNYFLCSKSIGAHMWYTIGEIIFPKYRNSISNSLLEQELSAEYPQNKQIKLSSWYSMYEKELKKNNFYDFEKETILKNNHKFNNSYFYMYVYTLLKEWELENLSHEITIDILESTLWKEGIHFTRDDEFKFLEKMAEKNIIKLNKQLNPITILKLKNSQEFIDKIFSLLI
ncbi:MAG: hypothetical protein ACRC1R_02090 [Cetobacterium sp.]|uniref:hypothetical protein n=1 Tax=Cetobacterium sp. TaxID=2071632 RepID=UPI003F3EC7BE